MTNHENIIAELNTIVAEKDAVLRAQESELSELAEDRARLHWILANPAAFAQLEADFAGNMLISKIDERLRHTGKLWQYLAVDKEAA